MNTPFIQDLLELGNFPIPWDDEDWGDVILPEAIN